MKTDGDLAIRVRGLSKSYTLTNSKGDRPTSFRESIGHNLRNPLAAFRRPPQSTFWALNDVNFDVKQGEVVGVIGRNGAGKSTLLKVLSRIAEPTAGRVELYGRVGSLLEVGTGFHPELTGRENIYLNGAILGMRRAEITKQFDAIVDFAGVEQFLDTPVKRYSSGMYVRLAFAVAAHLNPEILVVDEVLAVGDAEFQKKCLGKMRQVADGGRTVLFVSHQMPAVEALCTSAVVMQGGRADRYDDVSAAVRTYLHSGAARGVDSARTNADLRRGSGEYRFTDVTTSLTSFATHQQKEINFRYEQRRPADIRPFVIAEIYDERDTIVARCDTRLVGMRLLKPAGLARISMSSPWLKPGSYRVTMTIDSGFGFVDVFDDACRIDVTGQMPYEMGVSSDAWKTAGVLSDFTLTSL